MNNDNKYAQLKNELTQYLGGLITNSPEKHAIPHQIEAVLCETLISLARKEDGSMNMFTVKPVLRATSYIMKNRAKDLQSKLSDSFSLSDKNKVAEDDVKLYNTIATILDKLIEKIEEE